MNYLYLSPHFPPNYYLFAVNLARLGVNVLGLADEPYDQLRPELRAALTEYYRVGDMHNYDEMLRAAGYFIHRYGRIDRLDSHVEYWLDTEARLRTDFNVPGPRLPDMAQIKRKSLMKTAFELTGVPVARGGLVYSLDDARALLKDIGYPVVAKPDIGVGAANTFRLENDAGLARFFATKPPVDYVIEEFVDGAMITFDGLADQEGNPVFFGSFRYSHGVMETVNEDRHIYFYVDREVPADLEEAGRRVMRAFDVRERFFHFEFFRRPDGSLVAIEVNLRPPGGPVLDMYNYACDIDLYWGWANVIVNNRFVDQYARPNYCCYVGRKHSKNYLHSHEEIMSAFGHCILHAQPVPDIWSLAMGNFYYMVLTADKDEMLAAAHFIQEMTA